MSTFISTFHRKQTYPVAILWAVKTWGKLHVGEGREGPLARGAAYVVFVAAAL